MLKFMSFLLAGILIAPIAKADLPLPGPGAPPSEPPPVQPTPPFAPSPTPPSAPSPTPPPYEDPTYPPAPPPEYGRDVTYTLGSGQVGRFTDRSFNFYPQVGLRNLRALRITCTNNKIKIKSVKVRINNGREINATFLNGVYNLGDSRNHYLYSNNEVVKITVKASSPSLFRKNGAFRLDAAAVVKKSPNEETAPNE